MALRRKLRLQALQGEVRACVVVGPGTYETLISIQHSRMDALRDSLRFCLARGPTKRAKTLVREPFLTQTQRLVKMPPMGLVVVDLDTIAMEGMCAGKTDGV